MRRLIPNLAQPGPVRVESHWNIDHDTLARVQREQEQEQEELFKVQVVLTCYYSIA